MDTRDPKRMQGVAIFLLAINLLITVAGETPQQQFAEPQFAEPLSNTTVAIGKDVILGCVVDNLRGYKVAWVRVDTQTILSIHHNVIALNPRIALSYNDHRSWYLHIKNVTESDRGWYMCQINTDPMISKKGYLQVLVPPSILDEKSSSDVVIRENSNVTLHCKAKGFPEPYVIWRKENGEKFLYSGEPVNVVDGEYLHLAKVSRLQMGSYFCIASNGVPPSISKRIKILVQFPPVLSIPNQLEGACIGDNVTLECLTEAYPISINYWTHNNDEMIISGPKYDNTIYDNQYSRRMTLTIYNVSKLDFHHYKCVAKNSLGETDGVIRLDEIPSPITTPATTTNWPALPVSAKKEDIKYYNNTSQYIKNSGSRIIIYSNSYIPLIPYIIFIFLLNEIL